MPKKQVRNAFFFFMKELEPQLRREGRVFPNGMADVVPIAHPRWKALSDKEKERFEKMTRDYKAKMRGAEGDKFKMDNVGNIIANRKDENKELSMYLQKKRKEVKSSWPPGRDVLSETFYLINIQTLCVTEEGHYLPCELAVLEFNLEKGITKTFHRFIHPGNIPLGYKYTCINNSENTHQIPCERFELADEDYSFIWTQIKNFINPNQEKSEYPPLYCRPIVHKETKYCLEWLHGRALDRGPCRLTKLYDLEGLLADLYAHNSQYSAITPATAVDILTTTSYDFIPNHLCKFHEERECKYCSIGIVRRYAYAIFDHLAELYDFELTPQHLPSRPDGSLNVTVIHPTQQNSIFPRPVPQWSRPMYESAPISRDLADPGSSTFGSRDIRYAHSDDDDDDYDDFDDDITQLRLPKAPLTSAWGKPISGAPPGFGRGMAKSSTVDSSAQKFAGRATPPNASSAPVPPSVWQSGAPSNVQPSVQAPSGPGVTRQPTPNVPMGRGFARPPMPRPPGPGTASQQSSMSSLAGAGCGRGVLGPLAFQNTRMKVPVGRGFAPPAMMASLGSQMSGLGLENGAS